MDFPQANRLTILAILLRSCKTSWADQVPRMKSPSQTGLGLSQWRVQMTGLNEPLATLFRPNAQRESTQGLPHVSLIANRCVDWAAADAPFDDVRWYRASYSEWLIASCPSSLIRSRRMLVVAS